MLRPPPGSTHRLEEAARQPARLNDVGQEAIALIAEPEEGVEDVWIGVRVLLLDDVDFSCSHLSACHVVIARLIAASVCALLTPLAVAPSLG